FGQESDQAHHEGNVSLGGLHLERIPTCGFTKANVEVAATERHDQHLHALILVPDNTSRAELLRLGEQHSLQHGFARAGHADDHGVAGAPLTCLVQVFDGSMEIEEERAASLSLE